MHCWMGLAVSAAHSIDIKVIISWHITIITAVLVPYLYFPFISRLCLLLQSLIFPIPDETSLQTFLSFYRFPVSRKATRRITHGMGILTHDERPLFIDTRSDIIHPINHLMYCRIHWTNDITSLSRICSFINVRQLSPLGPIGTFILDKA